MAGGRGWLGYLLTSQLFMATINNHLGAVRYVKSLEGDGCHEGYYLYYGPLNRN